MPPTQRHLPRWFYATAINLLFCCQVFGQSPVSALPPQDKPALKQPYTFNVMAPLYLEKETEWQAFEQRLEKAREMGIDGVSVDVWWGIAEREGDQVFDWSYYRKMANLLKKYQLQWIPIMSFHQCGGNVGDDCNIPLPDWIWSTFGHKPASSLQFTSELGNTTAESVSLWQTPDNLRKLYQQYEEFMQAFEEAFADYAGMIQELNISMGPAGELRYPSYNAHDPDAGFPSRGRLQGFSANAHQSLLLFLKSRYVTVQALNQAWQTNFEGFEKVTYPHQFDSIFQRDKSIEKGFAYNYLSWYHQSLMTHGKRMLKAASEGFSGAFKHLPLGYKIPGIHWQIANTGAMHRSAELAAGLIPPGHNDKSNLWGYQDILTLAKQVDGLKSRDVIVHFTALEMRDKPSAPNYSRAKTLVSWLGKGAHASGISIKGENALAAGVHTKAGWDNIRDALKHQHYSGLTVLRINDVVALSEQSVGQSEYGQLIRSMNTDH